jgi:hypothetical protein
MQKYLPVEISAAAPVIETLLASASLAPTPAPVPALSSLLPTIDSSGNRKLQSGAILHCATDALGSLLGEVAEVALRKGAFLARDQGRGRSLFKVGTSSLRESMNHFSRELLQIKGEDCLENVKFGSNDG